jgi:hypothetical protein
MAFVVAHGGPAYLVAQGLLIGLKEPCLEFHVATRVVGHVSNMDPKVKGHAFFQDRARHGVVHRLLRLASGPAIAKHPEPNGADGASERLSSKIVGVIRGGQPLVTIVDRVVVLSVGLEVGNLGFVLEGPDWG